MFLDIDEPPPPYTPRDFYKKEKAEEEKESISQHHLHYHDSRPDHYHGSVTTRRRPAVQPRQRTADTTNDLNWGSEDEDEDELLNGAMGGMKL